MKVTMNSKKKKNNNRRQQVQKEKAVIKEKEEESSSSEDDNSDDESSASSSDDNNNNNKNKKTIMKKNNNKKGKGDDSDSDSNSDDDGSSSSSDESDDDEEAEAYTDDNAKWLKPKKKEKKSKMDLLASDDDESDDDDDDNFGQNKNSDDGDSDDDDDDDDDDDLLEIEKQSKLIDEEMILEKQEAEEEMRETVAKYTSVYHLPTVEEIEEDNNGNRVIPTSEIKGHIDSIIEVLANFRKGREEGRNRSEYVDQLAKYVADLYGYAPNGVNGAPGLVDYFLTMFSPAEALEFVKASDKVRPMVIRTNTLKMRRKDLATSLMKRGVTLDPLATWSKVGLKIIESPVPMGATPEYLSGCYMLQSASSMCPVMALAPQPNDTVLDMSSAPGGKTSYLAQLMRNTGIIYANDLSVERQKATVANMHRLGVKNVLTCAYNGKNFGSKIFKNHFDRILLDAPCSGLGVISRDPSVKVQRTVADLNKCSHLQKELLLSAIDALNCKKTNKKGDAANGIMVYSTCSIAVAENEEVVQYALSKRDIKLIDTGLDFGNPGFTRYQHKRFHPSVSLTRRFYPHVHNMDGFYVCKIQKLSSLKKKGEDDHRKTEEEIAAEAALEGEEDETADSTTAAATAASSKKKKEGAAKGKVTNNATTLATKKRKKKSGGKGKNRHLNTPPPETKRPKISNFPQSEQQQNRQQEKKKASKTNAKVTKPRRAKKET